jgi:hypothetical protein
MENRIPNERLREVSDGRAVLTVQELMAIIPEVAEEEHIQQFLAATVMVNRLIAKAKSTGPTRETAIQ